jgi:hypothetical protein
LQADMTDHEALTKLESLEIESTPADSSVPR